jgi:hypothetical protein
MKTSSELALQNIDEFLLDFLSEEIIVTVNYESSRVTEGSKFIIEFNNEKVLDKFIDIETNSFTFVRPKQIKNQLTIRMLGKKPFDTVVKDGIIIKDTYIKLENIFINRYELKQDFLKKHAIYKDKNNNIIEFMSGFWHDGCITLEFDWPFEFWFNDKEKHDHNYAMANLTDQSIEVLKNELGISLRKLRY